MGVTTNIDSFIRNLEKRTKGLVTEMRKATDEATKTYYAESKKKMNEEIYSKPVPTLGQVSAEKGIVTAKGKGAKSKAVLGRIITKNGKRILIPLRPQDAKKPAWKRTHNLRVNEKMEIVSPAEGQVSNKAARNGKGYAKYRNDAGKPGKRKTRYPAPWREDAMTVCRPKLKAIYRKHFLSAMTAGRTSGTGGLK